MKHFEKMSPSKNSLIKQYGVQYWDDKQLCIENLAKTIFMIKFMSKMYSQKIKACGQKIKAIKLNLVCKKFIKKMHNANKVRMPQKNRDKLGLSLNIAATSCILFSK